MNLSNDVLLVMLISVLASATDTNLNTNTNFLLLLLLTLQNTSSTGCCQNTCPTCNNSLF